MHRIFPGLFSPASPPPAHSHGGSNTLGETIVMIALGALSFLGASAFDKTAPGLATLLRCVPAGLTLVWLFRRCLPDDPRDVPLRPAPDYRHSDRPFWSLGYWLPSSPTMHRAPAYRAAPPPVYSAPPPVYSAPPSPTASYPPPPLHSSAMPIPPSSHPQSYTTYSAYDPQPSYPAVRPAPPPTTGSFPRVAPAAPNAGSFPSVAPAPPNSSFPRVAPAPASSGGPAPGYYSHPGTQRTLFEAADRR